MPELTRILLVDDNPKYLEEVLPLYGFDLTCAKNGIQALQILSKDPKFDMVLLDVMMPDMTGWEVLKSIRNNPVLKNLPVIMVTAVSEDKKMISGLKIGADDYIIKPFILPNLLARIEAVLRRTKRQSDNIQTDNVTISQADNFNSLTKREKRCFIISYTGRKQQINSK